MKTQLKSFITSRSFLLKKPKSVLTTILIILTFLFNNGYTQNSIAYKPTPEAMKIIDSVIREEFLRMQVVEVEINHQEADALFLKLINQYRKSKGLTDVRLNVCLDSASYLHSLWISKNKNVTHFETSENIDGKVYYSCLDRVNKYNEEKTTFNHLHENCSMVGDVGNSPFVISKKITKETIDRIFESWKSSPRHNEAMLHPNITIIGFSALVSDTNSQLSHLVYSTLVMASL